jgi:hypothetical protein
MAQWLVSPENPLTARVIANRFWESIFGVGIVRTSEEFGAQGELPVHPELLDWMALELIRSGWNVKDFLKMLMNTAAYRHPPQCPRRRRKKTRRTAFWPGGRVSGCRRRCSGTRHWQ